MTGLLYLVINTPNSHSLETVSLSLDTNLETKAIILLPTDWSRSRVDQQKWAWNENDSSFEFPTIKDCNEHFLFFSNQIEFADQIEATIKILDDNQNLKLARIVTFVDCDLLGKENMQSWMDGIAHFSDAICFSNRNNINSILLKEYTERYKSMHYPLETFILGKNISANRIFCPTARRISHVFDSPELLDHDETPDNDPYLCQLPSGYRRTPIPKIFA